MVCSMSKKCYRFFGGLLNTQEKWLNKMSEKGYRLVRTGKLLYEFEKCKPDEVTYCVEFILSICFPTMLIMSETEAVYRH